MDWKDEWYKHKIMEMKTNYQEIQRSILSNVFDVLEYCENLSVDWYFTFFLFLENDSFDLIYYLYYFCK